MSSPSPCHRAVVAVMVAAEKEAMEVPESSSSLTSLYDQRVVLVISAEAPIDSLLDLMGATNEDTSFTIEHY